MRIIFISFTFIVVLILLHREGVEGECERTQCDTTEYNEYIQCMQTRIKRATDCPYASDNPDEDIACDEECEDVEDDQGTCENDGCRRCRTKCSYRPCQTTQCCRRACHNSCRDTGCRQSCRSSCTRYINQTSTPVVVPAPNITVVQQQAPHNVTTIIHLNNIVNTTNNIHVPVNVNHTSYNNITVNLPQHDVEIVNKQEQPCCTVVGPRQCEKKDDAPIVHCFHNKTPQCGNLCQAPIVHAQQQTVCPNRPAPIQVPRPADCRQQTIYVPQPQPRCAYASGWPYVQCGGNARPQTNCEGCYNHYTAPAPVGGCSPYCYDDGYGAGPYYRQGPIYRPGYYHAPSCYQTGTCGYNPGYGVYNEPSWAGVNYGYGYPPNSYSDEWYFVESNPAGSIKLNAPQTVPEQTLSVNNDASVITQ